jgi:hypothetical protein
MLVIGGFESCLTVVLTLLQYTHFPNLRELEIQITRANSTAFLAVPSDDLRIPSELAQRLKQVHICLEPRRDARD